LTAYEDFMKLNKTPKYLPNNTYFVKQIFLNRYNSTTLDLR